MASSYSTDLKLELMVTGENSGTWGDKTNTNLNLIQQAIAGYQSIALTSTNTTLAMTDATISNARNAVIEFTGTIAANSTVYVASGIEKTYTIKNSTTGAFTLALNQVGGASVIWGTTEKNIKGVYLNGTNANTIDLSTLGGAISTSAAIGDFIIGPNELDTASVTSVKIASFAVTSGALDTASVTSVKVASGAIGTTQLATTGVTAATYTAATITVGADGRITGASSGSAGAGGFVPTLVATGPAPGTYTATAGANRLAVYMYAGGGGSGGNGNFSQMCMGGQTGGGTGGTAGYGFYNKPIAQPFSNAYQVGAGGTQGTTQPNGYRGNAGNAGTATNFTNVGTVNAGNAGNGAQPSGPSNPQPGNPGTAGNAPGASLVAPYIQYGQDSNYGTQNTPGVLIVYENTGT